MTLWGIIKGLLIQDETDRTKTLSLEVDPASTTATRTTLKSAQTIDRTLNLPDADDTLVGEAATQTLTNKTIDFSTGGTNSLTADAVDVIYDNTTSGLTATDSQSAIDEVEGRLDTAESDISNHISDVTDAHDASAISNIPAGNLVATDVQTALDELQTDIDTRATSTALSNHISNPTGAHAASAISNSPSGNLAATDAQAALNELQTDIDTRATSSALTSHTGSTSNPHSVTINQVSPLTTKGDILVRDATDNIRLAADSDGKVLTLDSASPAGVKWETAPGAAGGEANTTSNVGVGTGTLAKAKVGVDLPFKTIKAGANITINNLTDEVEIIASAPASGANDTLSNLSPTDINQDLIFDNTSDRVIEIKSTTAIGKNLTIRPGVNSTTLAHGDLILESLVSTNGFDSGDISLRTGNNTGSFGSGNINLSSGNINTNFTSSGDINVVTGENTAGNSGNIFITTGNPGTPTDRGYVNIAARRLILSSVFQEAVLIYASYGVASTTGLPVGNYGIIIIQSTAAITIHGIEAGQQGQHLIIYNENNNNMTFANQSGTETTVANRIVTCTGANVTSTGTSCHTLIYLSGRWVLQANQL